MAPLVTSCLVQSEQVLSRPVSSRPGLVSTGVERAAISNSSFLHSPTSIFVARQGQSCHVLSRHGASRRGPETPLTSMARLVMNWLVWSRLVSACLVRSCLGPRRLSFHGLAGRVFAGLVMSRPVKACLVRAGLGPHSTDFRIDLSGLVH